MATATNSSPLQIIFCCLFSMHNFEQLARTLLLAPPQVEVQRGILQLIAPIIRFEVRNPIILFYVAKIGTIEIALLNSASPLCKEGLLFNARGLLLGVDYPSAYSQCYVLNIILLVIR